MMRTPVLFSLSLTGVIALALPRGAEAEPTALPSEPLVVREAQCFGYGRNEVTLQGVQGVGRGYGAGVSGRATSSSAARPPAPAPAARPKRAAAPEEEAAPSFGALGDADDGAPVPVATAEVTVTEAPSPAAKEQERSTRDQVPELRQVGPRVDWGGVTWLSNDDSMSLASAQRLLFALDAGVGFTTSQIRPHELLNYFTFDTAAPRGRETFGVLPSAEVVDGDTLSLAIAVRGAVPERPPLDLTVLVDRSGSMNAEGRMDYTHRALRHLADHLRPGDRVDLVIFDDTPCTPLENFTVGRDDPALLYRMIGLVQPRGSTNLDAGLKEAYRVATDHASDRARAQRVMLFTDALLNTGDVNPHTVSEIGRSLEEHDIRLTGVGVGSEFRDDVLDKLTEKGKGAYVFLGSERVVDRLFDTGFEALVHTIAHDVRFRLDLPDSLGMERFYGEESSTRKEDVQPVHFHAGNSQVFLQDLALRDGRVVDRDPIELEISWDDPATGQRQTQTARFTVGEALRADPHNSRKGRALMAWTDVLTAHAMGAHACGEPFGAYRRALPGLEGDAEIAYVSELIGRWCGAPTPVASWTRPAFLKLRLDSDVAISAVDLDCPGQRDSRGLSASDKVATLEATPGTCQLTLHGAVPMTTTVDVPSTGMDLRCTIRGGRLVCDG